MKELLLQNIFKLTKYVGCNLLIQWTRKSKIKYRKYMFGDVKTKPYLWYLSMLIYHILMKPVFHLEPKYRVTMLTREEWTRGPGASPMVKELVWYTDGSSTAEGTGAGVYGQSVNRRLSIPLRKHATVFQAAVYAILACIEEIATQGHPENYENRLISNAHNEISRKRRHVFKQTKVGSKIQYFSYKLTYLFFDIVALSFNTFFPT